MLNVLQSNQLEKLALRFAKQATVAQPLRAETVVIPNPGMARWLWLYLAREHNVSANLDFLLPGSFVWRVFHRLLPDIPATSSHDPAVMTWQLHRLLRATPGDPQFSELRSWRDTSDDRMRFELAQKLAGLFDQYIIYRPDWIKEWRDRKTPGWQQTLWRRLADETAEPDWPSLRRRLEGLDPATVASVMPARVSVFGIPLLSPGYLDVLRWLSSHIDVNLFLPNPSQEYWAEIVPERSLAKIVGVEDEKALYIEEGNALLASWGLQARDLLMLVDEIEPATKETDFHDPGCDSVLTAVQSHILGLRSPGSDGQATEEMKADDRSIQVHVCHGETRELEVLHDQLLAMLDEDPSLSASDIVVMTPDIDSYAPYIDAVFSTSGKIPFSIADVSSQQSDPLVAAFLSLFDLPVSRFDASSVMSLLEVPEVSRRFGIGQDELTTVREWIMNTGIRWGLGADDREQHGRSQPELHSWRHGLDRLMLGFALPGQDSDTFDDLLPFDEVEGSAALVLGGLAEFVAKLKRFANELEQEKPAREWADWLLRQLDQFFSIADDAESEAQKLRNVFARLAEQSLAAKHDDRISSEIVSDWLIRQLRDVKSTGRYLGYGATFCGIVPMRNVPVPIVCLIGLNDTAFPRMESPVGFDLIAQKPRRGDRSRRDDDRHAFLESVMNARKVLYMSYIGRGIRDDASIPPCLLVSELLEYCNRAFERHDKKHPSDVMTTLHKVQGFSRKYFDASNPALFSYDDAISIRADQQSTPPEFVAGVIGSSVDELLPVSLDNLTRFFSDPAKALLQNRLGIFYSGDAEEINTHDPVSVYGLESWKLGSWMLQLRISGLARSHVKQMATKSRYAPGGAAGLVVIEKHMQQVDQMLEKLQSRLPEGQSHAVAVDCTESGIAITGRLENLYPNGQYLWRFGKTRAKDQLIFWIHHLVLNLAQPDGVANASVWISENKTLSLPPIEDAAQHLAVLTELFVCGLQQALPFFPDPSLAYVKNLRTRNGNRTKALLTAKTRYDIHLNQYGKDSQPYTQRVFLNGVDWDRFEELATAVFDPMLDYMR